MKNNGEVLKYVHAFEAGEGEVWDCVLTFLSSDQIQGFEFDFIRLQNCKINQIFIF
jgi:hypothetical protein